MTYKQQVAARLDEVTQPYKFVNCTAYDNDVQRRIGRHYRYARLPVLPVTALMVAGALGLGFALGVIWSAL